MPLILASTSRYRRELLERLHLPFHVARPEIDEIALPGETPADLAQRLARAKAQVIAEQRPAAWVIGSDQVAALGEQVLGKPHTRDMAVSQLQQSSGKIAHFYTAICLMRGETIVESFDKTTVHFRTLSDAEIDRYVEAEQPLDCAGGFKCEGLGISLFERIDNNDPTALIGLPLIALARMLREVGFEIP